MLWRKSKSATTDNKLKNDPEMMPTQSSAKLMHLPAITEVAMMLKNQLSITPQHWGEIYGETLRRFSKVMQVMPAGKNDSTLMFVKQLRSAISVLQLCQGKIFPQSVSTEERNSHEPRWIYAIFLVTLFHKLELIQYDRAIEVYSRNAVSANIWSPLFTVLSEKAFYKITWEAPKHCIEKSVFVTALVMQVVPAHIMQWLAESPILFSQWWDALLDLNKKNELSELVRAAFAHINKNVLKNEFEATVNPQEANTSASLSDDAGIHSSSADTTASIVSAPQEEEKNLPLLFIQWITTALTCDPESIDCLFYRVKSGLFITRDAINKFVALQGCTETEFFSDLRQVELMIPSAHGFIHIYCSNDYTERTVIEGLLLKIAALGEAFDSLPVTRNIQPDVLQEAHHDCFSD